MSTATPPPNSPAAPITTPPGSSSATPSGEGAASTSHEAITARLSELERDLAEARRIATEVRQEQAAQQALHEAGVIDLEAGLLLVKQRMADADSPDVPATVAAIRKAKPALFRPPSSASGVTPRRAPSPAALPALADEPGDALRQVASHAQQTGDRRSLLEYLRLRRARAAEAAD